MGYTCPNHSTFTFDDIISTLNTTKVHNYSVWVLVPFFPSYFSYLYRRHTLSVLHSDGGYLSEISKIVNNFNEWIYILFGQRSKNKLNRSNKVFSPKYFNCIDRIVKEECRQKKTVVKHCQNHRSIKFQNILSSEAIERSLKYTLYKYMIYIYVMILINICCTHVYCAQDRVSSRFTRFGRFKLVSIQMSV